eukprot:g4875.t1
MALRSHRVKPRQVASLLLLVLVLAAWAPPGSTAADHGADERGTKGSSGERGPVETLGTTTTITPTETALVDATRTSPAEGSTPPAPDHRGNTRRSLDVRLELADEAERHDGRLFDEPPAMANPVPDDVVQRCSRFHESNFELGAVCGGPLTEPCFERERCETGEGGATVPKIYVYDRECSLTDSYQLPMSDHSKDDRQNQDSYWREAVWKAGMLAETYEEACLFIHVNTHNHDEPCATRAPQWNGGVNNIMMEFTPWWREGGRRPHISNTYAMDWAFDSLSCYYRSGFDLSLPLVPGKLFPEYASTAATARKFFMTFKGTIYLRGFGLEERSAVSRVHDPANRIVSVVKCSTMHGDELLPENREYCDRSKERYDSYDYGGLMNSTFALVPSGRSPGTFRLGEIMSAGAIPVFVVRDWIKPFQEQIDWPAFSFSFTPDQVGPKMVEVLKAVPPDQLLTMQRKSLEAYWKIFGGVNNYSMIAANSIFALTERLKFHR